MATLPSRRHLAGWLAILIAAGPALSACTIEFTGITAKPPPPPTYYVSPHGNDKAAGTSPATAWRTLAKVSKVRLPPGSSVFLQGGQRFAGSLQLGPRDAGTSARPVVIGSYGGPPATIDARTGTAISVFDTAGVTIKGINLVGTPGSADGEGINVYNDLAAGHRLANISISNVDAMGFLIGIAIGGKNKAAGFTNVRVSDSRLHDNVADGLLAYGPKFDPSAPTYANQDVVISGVVAWGNPGNPHDKAKNSGNGIVLGSVSSGTITSSVAHDNGGLGASSEGPAGIWTYDSTGIDIEHNLAYANKTRDKIDGNGFGLDQNTMHSIMQHNFSYGNDGTGYLVYSRLDNHSERDNIVRDNISSYDARSGSQFYGGVTVLGYVADTAVYQNTVVMQPTGTVSPPVLRLSGALSGDTVRNNIFTTSSGPVVAAANVLSPSQVVLQGNDYHAVDGTWEVYWGTTATYGSLSQWRSATREEMANGQPAGLTADPRFTGPVFGLKVTSVNDTAAARGFALTASSPLIAAGLDLASLGTTPAAANFLGQAESARHPNVGAL